MKKFQKINRKKPPKMFLGGWSAISSLIGASASLMGAGASLFGAINGANAQEKLAEEQRKERERENKLKKIEQDTDVLRTYPTAGRNTSYYKHGGYIPKLSEGGDDEARAKRQAALLARRKQAKVASQPQASQTKPIPSSRIQPVKPKSKSNNKQTWFERNIYDKSKGSGSVMRDIAEIGYNTVVDAATITNNTLSAPFVQAWDAVKGRSKPYSHYWQPSEEKFKTNRAYPGTPVVEALTNYFGGKVLGGVANKFVNSGVPIVKSFIKGIGKSKVEKVITKAENGVPKIDLRTVSSQSRPALRQVVTEKGYVPRPPGKYFKRSRSTKPDVADEFIRASDAPVVQKPNTSIVEPRTVEVKLKDGTTKKITVDPKDETRIARMTNRLKAEYDLHAGYFRRAKKFKSDPNETRYFSDYDVPQANIPKPSADRGFTINPSNPNRLQLTEGPNYDMVPAFTKHPVSSSEALVKTPNWIKISSEPTRDFIRIKSQGALPEPKPVKRLTERSSYYSRTPDESALVIPKLKEMSYKPQARKGTPGTIGSKPRTSTPLSRAKASIDKQNMLKQESEINNKLINKYIESGDTQYGTISELINHLETNPFIKSSLRKRYELAYGGNTEKPPIKFSDEAKRYIKPKTRSKFISDTPGWQERASGRIDYSDINVDDLLMLGLVAKQLPKVIGNTIKRKAALAAAKQPKMYKGFNLGSHPRVIRREADRLLQAQSELNSLVGKGAASATTYIMDRAYGGSSDSSLPKRNTKKLSPVADLITNGKGTTSGTHEQGYDIPVKRNGRTTAYVEPGEVALDTPNGSKYILSKRTGFAQRYMDLEQKRQTLAQYAKRGGSLVKLELDKVIQEMNRLPKEQEEINKTLPAMSGNRKGYGDPPKRETLDEMEARHDEYFLNKFSDGTNEVELIERLNRARAKRANKTSSEVVTPQTSQTSSSTNAKPTTTQKGGNNRRGTSKPPAKVDPKITTEKPNEGEVVAENSPIQTGTSDGTLQQTALRGNSSKFINHPEVLDPVFLAKLALITSGQTNAAGYLNPKQLIYKGKVNTTPPLQKTTTTKPSSTTPTSKFKTTLKSAFNSENIGTSMQAIGAFADVAGMIYSNNKLKNLKTPHPVIIPKGGYNTRYDDSAERANLADTTRQAMRRARYSSGLTSDAEMQKILAQSWGQSNAIAGNKFNMETQLRNEAFTKDSRINELNAISRSTYRDAEYARRYQTEVANPQQITSSIATHLGSLGNKLDVRNRDQHSMVTSAMSTDNASFEALAKAGYFNNLDMNLLKAISPEKYAILSKFRK